MQIYDLLIIGSGTAAQAAGARMRHAGWSVALVDHRPFGGTCALRGCDPKKMLISGAETIDAQTRMRGHGVVGDAQIDWRSLITFKRSFTDGVPLDREKRFAESGIDAFHGCARFAGPNSVVVDSHGELKGRHILIATGAHPVPLDVPGQEHAITSEQFLELDALPARIALVGGGYIAAEFSHVAARSGGQPHVVSPPIGHDGDRMAAVIVGAVDQHATHAGFAHVAEGDFGGAGHAL